MNSIFFMYDMVSAVRAHGMETEIIHKKSPAPKKAPKKPWQRFGRKSDTRTFAKLAEKSNRHTAPQSFDEIRHVFMRDCTVLSPQQYIENRVIMADRPLFLEFQSMDNIHQGDTVLLNPSDIMSYGGTSNEGGVYITTFSGMMFIMPAELKAFAHAHEWHRQHGRAMPTPPRAEKVA